MWRFLGGAGALRAVAGLMVLLGVVGLITSFAAFGQARQQLRQVDAAVQNVATTLSGAAEGTGAVAGALGEGITNVAALLDQASRSVGETRGLLDASAGDLIALLDDAALGLTDAKMVLVDARGTVAEAGRQVPALVDGSAATVAVAAQTLAQTGTNLDQVSGQVAGARSDLALAELQRGLGQTRTVLSTNVLQVPGPGGGMLVVPLDRVQVTGDDLIQLATFIKSEFGLDTSALRAQGLAARANGIVWTFPSAEVVGRAAAGAARVEGVLGEAQAALDTSGRGLRSLGARLDANAQDIQAIKPTLARAAGQADRFLAAADQQVALMDRGVQSAANRTRQFRALANQELVLLANGLQGTAATARQIQDVADEQLAAMQANLKDTAAAIGGMSVAGMGGSVLGSLRWYMILTNVLFIAAGLGLFGVGKRLEQQAGA